MLNLLPSPLLGALGAGDILQRGIDTTQGIAQAWNNHWLNIFQSQLYATIVGMAGLFAAGSLVFFMLQFIRRMVHEEDYHSALQSLLIPLVIVVLLANNGNLLGKITFSLRGVIHNVSEQVLSTTLLEVKLQDAIQASVDKGAVSSQIGALLSQCQGMVGERQVECMKNANQQAQQVIQDYQSKHPVGNAFADLGNLLSQTPNIRAAQGAGEAFEGGLDQGLLFGGASYAAGFLGAISQSLVQVVLLAFQWAFANILEIAMLLTGLMGPIAVAGAFLYDGKSMWAWLTGFFSLGMAQVCYNIIVGVAAVVVVNAEVTDTMGFLVIIALLAPALALALAAGGGMAVFHVINSGAVGMLSTVAANVPGLKNFRGILAR